MIVGLISVICLFLFIAGIGMSLLNIFERKFSYAFLCASVSYFAIYIMTIVKPNV